MFKKILIPVTSEVWQKGVSLPIYPSLKDEEVNFICEKLKALL